MKVSPVYDANKNATQKYVVNQGGTYSTKTYSILQALGTIACEEKAVITITAEDVPNLKIGALRDFQTIISETPELRQKIIQYNQSDRIYYFSTGSIIEFPTFSDEQDAKSGKRDYLFVNEAQGVSYPIFRQLALRTNKRIFIDYNPTAPFWVHEKIIGKPDVKLIISDHRHNPFISEEKHNEIEGLIDVDYQMWLVYARGQTGKLEGLIWPDFEIIDDMPDLSDRCKGLDFGFNHPTALMDIRWDETNLYWDELIYQSGLITADIISLMKDLDVSQTDDIWADAARPDTIEEIYQAGYNIKPADKSVKDGINTVKAKKLHITRRSVNTIKEIRGYKWKVDKNGNKIDEPVKIKDDAMDAGRYGSYNGIIKPTFDYSW